ncbi:MAG: transposase, partial [Deltaproteobacteria bacterium]|nr:transposase [Deltaproteobacteria bacterium]
MTSKISGCRRAFLREFPDDESAETWFVARRWPDGVACASCGSHDVRRMKTRDGWWHCSACKHQTSLRSGTPLHGSRKPIRDWVYVLFCA